MSRRDRAAHWLSIFQAPPKQELPAQYPTRAHWVGQVKLDCMLCHQMGFGLSRIWSRPGDWEEIWLRSGFMENYSKRLGVDPLKRSLQVTIGPKQTKGITLVFKAS